MPIYEYHCIHCDEDFERLDRIDSPTVVQCPNCKGAATRQLSIPADTNRDKFDPTAREKLPTWNRNQKYAKWNDAWKKWRAANPVPGDRGSQCKVYHSDGLKEPK